MIQINDMFRLCKTKQTCWNLTVWWLEEWTPTDRTQGRWQRITKRMDSDSMDRLLERRQCPAKARDEFRAIV